MKFLPICGLVFLNSKNNTIPESLKRGNHRKLYVCFIIKVRLIEAFPNVFYFIPTKNRFLNKI